MRRYRFISIVFVFLFSVALAALWAVTPPIPAVPRPPAPKAAPPVKHPASVLDKHLLVAWYGNPWNGKMGILGRLTGKELAEGLRKQASAYSSVTKKPIVLAYELIASVAQGTAGSDGMYRRRESRDVIDRMLGDARAAGFKLILDIQMGRSTVMSEIQHLAPYLAQPDVYLALDPEFSMNVSGDVPGRKIGTMPATEVNDAISALECIIDRYNLPPKVLIVHQFTTGMLPDKDRIYASSKLDVVLDMDGFGPPWLKRNTYRAVLHQRPLAFTGFKLFYIQDTDILQPHEVLGLSPSPSVIIYQ